MSLKIRKDLHRW